jgi:competence protein ComEC
MLALLLSASWSASLLAYLRGYRRVQLVSIALLAGGAGWLLASYAATDAQYPPLRAVFDERIGNGPVAIEGRLRGDGVLTENGVSLRVDVVRVDVNGAFEEVAGGVSVSVGGMPDVVTVAQWTAGRVIRAPMLLRRPARYLNEGLGDQERVLARRGVALVGTIKSAALVEVVDQASWWEEAAARVRARTRVALRRHVAPVAEPSAAIATAILIGDRAGLSADLERRLQEAGTYHVIAISGGNIAILAGGLFVAFRLVGMRGRIAAAVVIGALTSYALVASGGASVLRATLMAVVYLAVRLIDQRTAAENAVSLTAAIVLLGNPLAIADVGFWLTFGATVALITGGAHANGATAFSSAGSALIRSLVMLVVATAYVELALAPIGALVFQRVTLAGLLLNLVALPAMTVVQIAAMAVVVFDTLGLPGTAAALAPVVHVGAVMLTDSTNLLDYAPWLTWRTPSPHPSILAGYYTALALAVVGASRHWPRLVRRMAIAASCLLFLAIVGAPAAHVRAGGDGLLHLDVLDVGQGDSMLLTFPNGRTLLLDTGGVSPRGDFDIGDRVIGPSIRARNLLALDYLAVTHGDPDHIGGAGAIVRDFAPGEIWWGIPVANHQSTLALRDEAARWRIPWRTLQRGDRLDIGGVELRVHHPPPPDWERQRVRNDDSLVIELRYRDVSMLLTGDIGRAVEHDFLATVDLRPTVILKVAHHGSATSSSPSFVARVRPAIALIGVGRGNPYGHPVAAVLDRLQDAGAEVFRTDLDGEVKVSTDGHRVEVRTFTGKHYSLTGHTSKPK